MPRFLARLAATAALAAAACGRGAGTGVGEAEGYVAGRTYVGEGGYVEYVAGDLPIVLAAPHGGELAPPGLAERTDGACRDPEFSATDDQHTQALARLVADSLAARTGRRPHLVVNRLARRKLDANRDSARAACGSAGAGRAWREYQGFLDAARAAVARGGAGTVRGLVVDVHGHGHRVPRVELGYLLSGAELDRADAALDASAAEARSSIRTLSLASPLSFARLLRGPASLGALLEARGYAAVPSPAAPGPAGERYFPGGYTTERHGCADGGPVCAVQAELPLPGVRATDAERRRFAGALADALLAYLREHAGRPAAGP
jgi:N-formylglutamate amidohydrolase